MSRISSTEPLQLTEFVVAPAMTGRRKVVRLRFGEVTVDLAPGQAEALATTLTTMADLALLQ